MVRFVMRVAVVAAAARAVAAQGPLASAHASGGRSATDSAHIVRVARSEQTGFETFRRNHLPEAEGASGPCDVRIGRYCYWRGDDDDVPPPPEKPEIRARRDKLIAVLDSSAHSLAGDAWLAGQTVRYLVEANRTDDALTFAARDCHAAAWWCAALAGYAAHTGGRYAAADSEFSNALAAMDSAERARWLDIGALLDGPLADRYGSLAASARAAFTRRVFWLGAPLLSVSSTDLFTEQLARITRVKMAEHAATPDGSAWADDERDLMVRYGWPRWYSRTRPDFGSQREPSITGHDDGMPYDFLPSLRVVDHIGAAAPSDWQLDDAHASTGYAAEYARSIHDVPHQIAVFRRGDSSLVIAGWDARRDTTLLGRSLDAALVIAWAPESSTVARLSNAGAVGRIAVTGVADSGLVSLELFARADRRAGRARVGLTARVPGSVALSDLLLYAPAPDSPTSLDAVRDSALTSEIIPASRATGVYWELYGLPPNSAPAHFTLTIEQTDVSWMHHVAERLRFADPTTALRIQWDEVPQQRNGVAARGLRVDLSQLRDGRYRLELGVATAEGIVSARRDILVR